MIKHALISIRMKPVLTVNYILKYAAEDDFSAYLCKGKIEPQNTYEVRQILISFEISHPTFSFSYFSVLEEYLFLNF